MARRRVNSYYSKVMIATAIDACDYGLKIKTEKGNLVLELTRYKNEINKNL